MKRCEVCNQMDNVRKVDSICLCWSCRRTPILKDVPKFKQPVLDKTGYMVLVDYSKLTKICIMRDIHGL